ncbi:putative ankyrin repeat protein RF_0381 [Nasonia vitripennis]|uniref:Ankyrin repeat protein n=1 Tax=Nasonia vitripennis TaxID=7425 RepID=A0A7M7Q5J1_NASVI|nr:putative ankyrin repeat protein RF_0381 [Nasonia vitripennis]
MAAESGNYYFDDMYRCSKKQVQILRLKQAIQCQNLPLVKVLLKKIGRVTIRDFRDDYISVTFLHHAAKSGNCAINRRLVLAGCRINEADENGETALVWAIRYQNFKLAEQLIKYGADVNVKNNDGLTALMFAVTNAYPYDDNVVVLRHFLHDTVERRYCIESRNFALKARDNEVLQNRRRKNETSHSAMRISLAKMLLFAGADVNHKDNNGCSPIQCAIYTSDLKLLKFLISAGAVIESQNSLGVTALHDAVLNCNKATVQLLLSHGGPSLSTCLNIKTLEGNTPLHWAALFNKNYSHADIINLLLEYPVDLNSPNVRSQTPFHFIAMNAGISLAMDFIMRHADLQLEDHIGMNALHYAMHNEDKRVFNRILEMESGIPLEHKCDERGRTVLHFASQFCSTEYIRYFVDRGADVNAKDIVSGATPLYLCINHPLPRQGLDPMENRKESISLLLEYGTDVNIRIRDDHGDETTIIQKAIELRNIEIICSILEFVAITEAKKNKPVLDDYNRAVLNDSPDIKGYYEKCRVELEGMKNRWVDETSRTYFHMLTESVEVLARFVRNKAAAKELRNSDYPFAYPIYRLQLRAKIEAALSKQKSFETACDILMKTWPFSETDYFVCEATCEHLSDTDIKFLIDSGSCNKSVN